jgi:hypothetical protein
LNGHGKKSARQAPAANARMVTAADGGRRQPHQLSA